MHARMYLHKSPILTTLAVKCVYQFYPVFICALGRVLALNNCNVPPLSARHSFSKCILTLLKPGFLSFSGLEKFLGQSRKHSKSSRTSLTVMPKHEGDEKLQGKC